MPVGPGSIQDIWPLSPLQEEILFHTLAAPGSGAHVVQSRFVLRGALDVDAFERAWQGAVDRHAVLRVAFAWEELEEPVQVVLAALPVAVAHQDWRGLSPAARAERMAELLGRDRERGFDPARAPLMRLLLVRTGEAEHELLWTRHHVLLDGWSDPLVFADVVALYSAAVRGEEAPLPPARPYGDYVAWLRRRDPAAAGAFWRAELRGVEGPTRLETGPGDGTGYASEEVKLAGPAAAAFAAWTRRAGLTPGTAVHGAWALLLSRYTGQDDVVFGSVASGRPAALEGADRMVGLFINTLPVRVRVPEAERVEPWLRELQAAQARSREWEHASPARVRAWSGLPPGTPLWESLLVFQNYPVDPGLRSAAVPGLRLERRPDAEQPGYPLMLSAALDDELTLRAVYDRARFTAAAVRRVLAHLRALLRAMAAGPQRRLGELEMLDADERARLVEGWNSTAVPYPRERCLHERWEEQAAADPDAPALLWGAERVPRGELARRANRLAHHLRALGAGPEVRVGVCLERSPDSVAAVLGVLGAGAAYVPLDPGYPAERLEHVLRDSGARLLVTVAALAERVDAPGVRRVLLDADADALAARPGHAPRSGVEADNAAYVTYTSGSTGRPKGVVGTHRNAHNRLAWLWRGHPPLPGEVWSHKTALGFVDSNLEIFGALGAGVPLAVLPEAVLRDPEALAEGLAGHGCTRLVLVPSLLRALLDAHPDLGARLPRLRLWITSGERLPPDLLRRFRAAAPGAVLLNLYGTSEVIDATCQALPGGGEDGGAACSAPIGLPIDNVRALVLDAGLRPVPVGVAGELYVAGDGVARGYHGRPERTAERFLPDPFAPEPGGRMYRTGDRARRGGDGALEYLGRADAQAKVRGFRVEPGEVEAVLREHPAVGDAAVAAREDAASGVPGEVRLVAYVAPREGAPPPDASALRGWAAERLPAPMVPTAWVPLERIPLLPNGKTDRLALPAPGVAAGPAASHAAPRDALELRLARAWEEVLRRPVGVRDSFVELGGDSIAAIRAALRMSRPGGARVSPTLLLAEGTVERLAAALRRGAAEADPSPLVPLRASGSRPPLFLVHALGGSALAYLPLAGHLDPEQPVYGLQSPGLDGAPGPAAEVEAMAEAYLEAVREVRPRGPYRLGGWSMGGLVAWEMARRLRERGEEVELLALVDTFPPGADTPRGELAALASFARHLGLPLDGAPTPAEARALGVEGCLARLLDAGRAAGVLPPETDPPELRRRFDVLRANRAAAAAYRPGPFDGRVLLLLAGSGERAPAGPWERLAGGGAEVRALPGDHFSLVREPHVRALAAELAAALAGAPATAAALAPEPR